MSDFNPAATLRTITFTVSLVPGTQTVATAGAYYEVVLPSGRVVPLSETNLDLVQIQDVVNAVAANIVTQLLTKEGLTQLTPPEGP
jgi:hypothetical protein